MTDPIFPLLIAGYGNFDRQDDGAAWHILTQLAHKLEIPLPVSPELFEFTPGGEIDLWFSLHLYPEMAEIVARYSFILFIDAHTGAIPEDLHIEDLHNRPDTSPFTHHLTPEKLLNLTAIISQVLPPARLISIRGYSFGFSQQLSPQTQELVTQAVEHIFAWIKS
jgi:hydrogenase maturation protease